ncbi:BON domain-containing protein [Streptomyces sp. TRM43335]|uniref:BON domain-containing protein n=1 Tax=Streptomyces taklimakanensis TaxID=2569853 RepID=A0A6G2B7B1_9ACTN|nr:BON domain-containing protein [Streptomyces taklimakanensis]MTE18016.1 BON domain-containing protein [Streptomyces taklimakanensis]
MTDRDTRRTGGTRAPETSAGGATGDPVENIEYRIAHLQERLVREEIAELGMRVEVRGGTVLVSGTAPSSECRDTITRIAEEELAGVPVRTDIVVADTTAPDRPEELA